MKLHKTTLVGLLLGSPVLLAGCPGDDSPPAEDSTGSTTMEPMDSTGMPTPDPSSSTGTTMVDPDTSTTNPPDTDTETDGGGYMFNPCPPEDFEPVDRMGMPAINSAVISSKDDYNVATPADDAAGTFVPEIVANVEGLHMALDDDLMGLGLVPCAPMDCVMQAAPLVVPDTIKITLGGTVGFPNGRLPADPVIDVTLAVVLLDLSAPGQDALTLAGVPVNPPANDVEFPTDFPYFAPAN